MSNFLIVQFASLDSASFTSRPKPDENVASTLYKYKAYIIK